jgi:hypothetical protein
MKKLTSIAVSAMLIIGIMGMPAVAATPYASTALKTQLKFLAEEEKLARDVYTILAKDAAFPKFKNIARAEQFHMDQLAPVLKTYGITNPNTTRKAGVYLNKDLAALYKTLVAKGKLSTADAIAVGVTIETADLATIADVEKLITQDDIQFVINYLKAGSINHLAAFKR